MISNCRICGKSIFKEILNLGRQHLQGCFLKAGIECPDLNKYPLNLIRCENCHLVQLDHTVNTNLMYKNYWYRSGISNTMKKHLQNVANECQQFIRQDLNYILDIGCNDGTLLSNFPHSVRKFGIDPSDTLDNDLSNYVYKKGYYPYTRFVGQKFDTITSIAMFYDVDDPITFAKQVREDLATHGLWILEIAYLQEILKNNGYDTICNEHLCYYTIKDINNIAKKAGLKIVNIIFSDCNGGSVRFYLTQDFSMLYDEYPELELFIKSEEDSVCLDKLERFQSNCQILRSELKNYIKSKHLDGKKIHILGASTKGNTILQYCQLNNKEIECASDRDNKKHGGMTLGTSIPIVSEEESRQRNPNYYLVLPWHFKREIIHREWNQLRKGTKFIFPLPKVEEYGFN